MWKKWIFSWAAIGKRPIDGKNLPRRSKSDDITDESRRIGCHPAQFARSVNDKPNYCVLSASPFLSQLPFSLLAIIQPWTYKSALCAPFHESSRGPKRCIWGKRERYKGMQCTGCDAVFTYHSICPLGWIYYVYLQGHTHSACII